MRALEFTRSEESCIVRFRAMGGPCEVLVDTQDEAAARALGARAAECAWRIEDKFSRYREDNIVARINTAGGVPVEVDEETGNLLDFADLMYRLSNGSFDITSGVLRRAWTFDGGTRVPTASELDRLLAWVGWSKVRWERPTLTLLPEMQIDFGGIAKEYAVDQAVQQIARVSELPVLVNFGGDLATTGERRGGKPWRVGIEDVASANGGERRAGKLIELTAGALATSGDTYRFVTADGARLPHILDPRDGFPVRGAPRSVTVAAPTCTNAGMLTTLAMLRGPEAERFLENEGVRHWIQR